jgi:hypothetical protein
MDANQLLIVITAFIAASPGLVALLVQFKKGRAEAAGLDADTAEKYQRIADNAAKRLADMDKRLEDSETRISELEAMLHAESRERKRFEDWARRLAHQVESLGATPVSLEDGRKKTE